MLRMELKAKEQRRQYWEPVSQATLIDCIQQQLLLAACPAALPLGPPLHEAPTVCQLVAAVAAVPGRAALVALGAAEVQLSSPRPGSTHSSSIRALPSSQAGRLPSQHLPIRVLSRTLQLLPRSQPAVRVTIMTGILDPSVLEKAGPSQYRRREEDGGTQVIHYNTGIPLSTVLLHLGSNNCSSQSLSSPY